MEGQFGVLPTILTLSNPSAFVAGNWHRRVRALRKGTSAASNQSVQMDFTQSLLYLVS